MKREIKFRVYANTDDGMKMVYLNSLEFDNGLWFQVEEHIDDYSDAVMQYTGFDDKVGNGIYEGDILMVDKHQISNYGYWAEQTTTVTFELGCFVHRSGKGFFGYIKDNYQHSEVIGNIYELQQTTNNSTTNP